MIIGKHDLALKPFRKWRNDRAIRRTCLVMVHGKPDQAILDSVSILNQYRCNGSPSYWLSLLSVEIPFFDSATSLKVTLKRLGFPVVGSGKAALSLSRGSNGTFLATVAVSWPENSKFEYEIPELDRMRKFGAREESFWNATCEERRIVLKKYEYSGCLQDAVESRQPLGHFTGHQQFGKNDFKAKDGVFTPHVSSLALVDTAVQFIQDFTENILDLGTGSGCLLLSVLDAFPCNGYGIDINHGALSLAQENAQLLGIENVSFKYCDYTTQDVSSVFPGVSFSVIICNPPYLPEQLASSFEGFEPKSAVSGGSDGLDMYREIAALCKGSLQVEPGAKLILEAPGNFKHDLITKIFSDLEFCGYGEQDAKGMNRCLVFKF